MRHTLHIYQKPKLGSGLLVRLPVFNYRHKISAVGWFDTASCDIAVPPDAAETFLDQHIGSRVAIFVDNPVEPIWEGFINRMTFAGGGYTYTISLDEMINRASVIHSVVNTATPQNTAVANNTSSQAVYGIKAGRVELGFQYSAGTGVTGLRDTILAQRAWPKASIVQGGGEGLVTLELLGFWHTLAWEIAEGAVFSSTGNSAINTLITADILPNVQNGTTFFNNADTSMITANALTLTRNRVRGQTIKDILTELAEVGDGSNTYIVGLTPTNPATGLRRLYYRAANTAVQYTARRGDGLRLRNSYGQPVRPWAVTPDAGVRITDMLPGWNGLGDDPRETWISSLEYNANEQMVAWSGADNITAEGVFQLHQYNRQHGRVFGASRRFV